MELPLSVPVKLPIIVDPLGVTKLSTQVIFGNVPETCNVLSQVVLVFRQVKLDVVPPVVVDTQLPTTWADEDFVPLA